LPRPAEGVSGQLPHHQRRPAHTSHRLATADLRQCGRISYFLGRIRIGRKTSKGDASGSDATPRGRQGAPARAPTLPPTAATASCAAAATAAPPPSREGTGVLPAARTPIEWPAPAARTRDAVNFWCVPLRGPLPPVTRDNQLGFWSDMCYVTTTNLRCEHSCLGEPGFWCQ